MKDIKMNFKEVMEAAKRPENGSVREHMWNT